MSQYNPLSWQNENGLCSYPFLEDLEIQDLLVDAHFVQFDNFVPRFDSVQVEQDRLLFNFTFDYGVSAGNIFYKEIYERGEEYRVLRLYNTDGSRYMGTVTIGLGAQKLWESYIGRKLVISQYFSADTVSSIPLKDAVYLLDSNYGDVLLSRTLDDNTVFYNVSDDLNAVVFNAVYGHTIPDGVAPEGLRKINLVPPLNNNINLASNDIIKITSRNAAALYVDLVSGAASQSFALPTLIA